MKWPRLALCMHRFQLSGLNLERFINLMNREDIPLHHVRRRGARQLTAQCFSADLPRIRSLTGEKGWKMEHVRAVGLSGLAAGMKRRKGVPLGIVLACALVLALSQFVWQIHISGAGAHTADIRAYLQAEGYGPGTRRSSVDASALEAALTYRYPDIAWFHVYVRGASLVVEVAPGVPSPEVEAHSSCDVIAAHMGIVDSVRVYAGTSQVKRGDVVQKGDVLIRGVERSSDGSFVPVAASGVVIARCWHSETVSFPLFDVSSSETGREHVFRQIRTPLGILAQRQQETPFLAYNTYLSETPVGGAFFPLTHQRITRREVAMEYVPRDVSAVRAEAESAAFKRLKTTLKNDDIIDKWVDYCMIEGDTLALSATAEWLMDIGENASP